MHRRQGNSQSGEGLRRRLNNEQRRRVRAFRQGAGAGTPDGDYRRVIVADGGGGFQGGAVANKDGCSRALQAKQSQGELLVHLRNAVIGDGHGHCMHGVGVGESQPAEGGSVVQVGPL